MDYSASSFIQTWRTADVLLVFPAGNKLSSVDSGTPGRPKGGFHGLNSAPHKAWVECSGSSLRFLLVFCSNSFTFSQASSCTEGSTGRLPPVPKLTGSFPQLTRESGITTCRVESTGQKSPLESTGNRNLFQTGMKNKAAFENRIVSPFHIVHLPFSLLSSLRQLLPSH